MFSKFSIEEDEKLIDMVREHPALYKDKSRTYKDSIVKNNIWKRISKQLGRKDKDCKARWKSIRDYYQRKKKDYLNDTEAGSANDDYEDNFSNKFQHLRFLDIAEKKKNSKSRIDNNDNSRDNYQQGTKLCKLESEVLIVERGGQDEDFEDLQQIKNEVPTTTDISMVLNNKQSRPDTAAKRKRGMTFMDKNTLFLNEIKKGRAERTAILRKLINRPGPSSKSEQESCDPASDMFFKSISATVSTFPPIQKAKIKAEIMSIVSRYEIEQAAQQLNVSTAPSAFANSNYAAHPTSATPGHDSSITPSSFHASSDETCVRFQSVFIPESCNNSHLEPL